MIRQALVLSFQEQPHQQEHVMDITEIQKRVDAIARGMQAKAVSQANAEFSIRAHRESCVMLSWAKHSQRYADEHKWFKGNTVEECLAKAEAYVAALPSPEEARMTAFMSALAEAVELGKKNDIDVEFVNPLVALMKRLSKNALQHQAQP